MAWNRVATAAASPVAAVAVVAGIVSYSHVEGLALVTGESLTDARLLPLAVDGLIVAGSVVLLAGYALGWLAVGLGVTGTLFANVMHGLPYGPAAAVVAAWPACAFSVSSYILERFIVRQGAVHATRTASGKFPEATGAVQSAEPAPAILAAPTSTAALNGHGDGWSQPKASTW